MLPNKWSFIQFGLNKGEKGESGNRGAALPAWGCWGGDMNMLSGGSTCCRKTTSLSSSTPLTVVRFDRWCPHEHTFNLRVQLQFIIVLGKLLAEIFEGVLGLMPDLPPLRFWFPPLSAALEPKSQFPRTPLLPQRALRECACSCWGALCFIVWLFMSKSSFVLMFSWQTLLVLEEPGLPTLPSFPIDPPRST